MPLYGHELTRATTPLDAGLGRFVDFDKGDFTGREALVAQRARGDAGCLVGLAGAGRRAARADHPVIIDGAQAGAVTSGALSPTLGHPIALAALAGPATPPEPGTVVQVDVRGRLQDCTVVGVPFYRRPKPTHPTNR